MQLTVKTLKGGKFVINAEPSSTIMVVKGLIEQAKSELPAANMKLIHSGKVLKDTATIGDCNIKENDFVVVMVTKVKKEAAAAASKPATQTEQKEDTKAAAASPMAVSSTEPSSNATPANAAATAPAAAEASDEFPAEVLANLTGMGFPEAEVKACLRASHGNPDVAVEFLTNGIPPAVQALQQQPTSSASLGSASGPLEGLRNHPQFNSLRRLVQSNPQTLQAVLTQIGQQQPELLRQINSNQAAFLEMMNEPVEEDATVPSPSSSTSAPSSATISASSPATGGNASGMLSGMSNPAQMAQMLQNMNPTELQSMATMMGLTPEQLTATAQMISQMPPDQFQEYMNMVQSGGMPGLGELGAGGSAAGGAGPQIIRLNEEEMAAVDRLTDMGFDHTEAAQAYLACDKNEALAANLLMDGGFGFGDDMGNGNSGGNGGENDDDMYD
eukprot:CAMPEP_0197832238 /NCGR_PEP_ID=MMETSP1437-20131217/13867_1 /TAXON_ID=49252 ORGANISM="Eucampia antarctica, Strain CCMP1452" /NCGR_SAMPLE_ID=MMETSP1437 /ASSEMBLY_ACC=CAM_ASM_001096 /LENGTH=443 /DNA_ID=CAMNT_0043435495 /DNA_START=72 /DNA_END=1403 /DNA_ORIENTATION=+